MRYLFFALGFVFYASVSKGQGVADTVGLTGTEVDTVVARRLLKAANELSWSGKHNEAYELADSAQGIWERTLGKETREVADALFRKGRTRYNQNRNNEALPLFQSCLAIRLKVIGLENPDVAMTYTYIGGAYDANDDYDKALEYYQKGLEINLKVLGSEKLETARSYNMIASCFNSKGEYDKAIENGTKALNIRLKLQTKDNVDIGSTYRDIGIYYSNKGEVDLTMKYYLIALNILTSSNNDEPEEVANIYSNIFGPYLEKGEFKKAEEYLLKSLKIRLQLFGEAHHSVAESYNNLGICYSAMGLFDKSLAYNQKALSVLTGIVGDNHPYLKDIYNNIGVDYLNLKDYNKSLQFLKKSLSIAIHLYGDEHPKIADCYHNLGNTYVAMKEYDRGIEYFLSSISILIKSVGEKHPQIAGAYNNIGITYTFKKDYKRSIEFFKKALSVEYAEKDKSEDSVASYISLSKSYSKLGLFMIADSFNKKTLDVIGFYNTNDLAKVKLLTKLIAALMEKSNMERSWYLIIKNPEILYQSYYTCRYMLLAARYQSQSPLYDFKISRFNDPTGIYDIAITTNFLLYQYSDSTHYLKESFQYAEQNKALVLFKGIRESDALQFANIPDTLLQMEHALRIDLSWQEKQRQTLLDKNLSETDTSVLRISSIVFDLRLQYEALKDTFEIRYPDYYCLKYDLSTVSLDYVQDTLLQPNQTLLEYFSGDSALYIFAIRHDTFAVVEVKQDAGPSLDSLVRVLRHGLTDYHVKNSKSAVYLKATADEYADAAFQLYQKLVAPVAGLLQEKIIVVPDGVLGYIPFDVLLTRRPAEPTRFHSHEYFGKEKQISYAYSATLLREMHDKKHKIPATETLLALAPFYQGNADTLFAKIDSTDFEQVLTSDDSRSWGVLTALPASGQEVKDVSALFKGKSYYGQQSPKEILLTEAGKYRILHLSTHGRANDQVGDYAWLAFAAPGDTMVYDKFYVKDIYNLSLNADLVTLSACETGIGELKRGEGIISLARAFAYAGAKSIVTTLWPVNDALTSDLMRLFYQNLKKGMDKDTALWQAKKDFLVLQKKGSGAHPYFWSGFIPVGDMQKIGRN